MNEKQINELKIEIDNLYDNELQQYNNATKRNEKKELETRILEKRKYIEDKYNCLIELVKFGPEFVNIEVYEKK